jgi:integrating conjugative element protein (TIGR03765 family)
MKALLPFAAALALAGAGAGMAAAGPRVLTDTGRTVSSVQYLVHALDSSDSDTETALVSFPVRIAGMSPGVLANIDHALDLPPWLTRPVFLVGSDPASLRWLAEHHAALRRLDAAGIVIAVEHVSAFKAMRRATSLPLVPHPAPHLVQLLQAQGIHHYPLLLMESGDVRQDLAAVAPDDPGVGSGR